MDSNTRSQHYDKYTTMHAVERYKSSAAQNDRDTRHQRHRRQLPQNAKSDDERVYKQRSLRHPSSGTNNDGRKRRESSAEDPAVHDPITPPPVSRGSSKRIASENPTRGRGGERSHDIAIEGIRRHHSTHQRRRDGEDAENLLGRNHEHARRESQAESQHMAHRARRQGERRKTLTTNCADGAAVVPTPEHPPRHTRDLRPTGETVTLSTMFKELGRRFLAGRSLPPHGSTHRSASAGEVPLAAKHAPRNSSGSGSTRRRFESLEDGTRNNSVPPKLETQKQNVTNTRKSSHRLGKTQLGRYAHESQMPTWLTSMLSNDLAMRQAGMIEVLEQLLRQAQTVEEAWLCHPAVDHISKLRGEGGFCGYRNIQMLSSYIINARADGHCCFTDGSESQGTIPGIFVIQDLIEEAWDKGINVYGRVETGGIRGTRKFIGTPEAQAMLISLGIRCTAKGFRTSPEKDSTTVILEEIEAYFRSGTPLVYPTDSDHPPKVHATSLPPIYFQHRGHSLTIVGIEKLNPPTGRNKDSGAVNLLVFDPSRSDSRQLKSLVGQEFQHKQPHEALEAYRRGKRYLDKFQEFEILCLGPPRK